MESDAYEPHFKNWCTGTFNWENLQFPIHVLILRLLQQKWNICCRDRVQSSMSKMKGKYTILYTVDSAGMTMIKLNFFIESKNHLFNFIFQPPVRENGTQFVQQPNLKTASLLKCQYQCQISIMNCLFVMFLAVIRA